MKNLFALILGTGLLLVSSTVGSAAPNGQWERYGHGDYSSSYDPLRSVVNQTQNDLRMANDLQRRRKGDDRYAEAQGHLSTFDRKLTQGKFDKGELKKSIDKIKDILDKNVLQASSRDALMRDVQELERARYSRY